MSNKLDLIDSIAADERSTIFSRALSTSGADQWLKGEGSFTVFVPTDDAFAKMPEATMEALLAQPGHADLKALISYHILPGKVMAANIPSVPTRASVTGLEIKFTDNSGIKVNNSVLQARNLEASNGVVHALDTVLTAQDAKPVLTPNQVMAATVMRKLS